MWMHFGKSASQYSDDNYFSWHCSSVQRISGFCGHLAWFFLIFLNFDSQLFSSVFYLPFLELVVSWKLIHWSELSRHEFTLKIVIKNLSQSWGGEMCYLFGIWDTVGSHPCVGSLTSLCPRISNLGHPSRWVLPLLSYNQKRLRMWKRSVLHRGLES